MTGVCLQVDVQVPLTTTVRISYPEGEFLGVVKYCQFKEIGYYLGIQFEDGYRWSRARFKPQHLLDPRKLLKPVPQQTKNGAARRPAN